MRRYSWILFAKTRWKEENKRKSDGETKFADCEAFELRARKLMGMEHIEDRVSERTASRIIAMSKPTYINAPDNRRSVL